MNIWIPVVNELLTFHKDKIHRWYQLMVFVLNLC